MNAPSLVTKRPPTTLFDLEGLESLPCGCVAALYRARPWDVALIALEAKGPHCVFPTHSSGSVLRLGELSEAEPDVDIEGDD